MAKILAVGDLHVVEEELEDCQNLIDGVHKTAQEEEPDFILFLGDQTNNHKLFNLEVLRFWKNAFTKLKDFTIVAVVGNHDKPGDASSKAHSMMAFDGLENLIIIDQLTFKDGCTFIPYRHDNQDFVNDVLCTTSKVVFCHATFTGAKFENGIYAKDGIDPSQFPDRTFISGHIHNPHKFGNVYYPGAPRWRTLSDTGTERSIVLIETDGNTYSVLKEFDTSQWCQKLIHLEDREEAPLDMQLNPRWKYIVDMYGSEKFISDRRKVWAGCRLRTFKTQTELKLVSESMGIPQAIQAFMESYTSKYGTPSEMLRAAVNRRLFEK